MSREKILRYTDIKRPGAYQLGTTLVDAHSSGNITVDTLACSTASGKLYILVVSPEPGRYIRFVENTTLPKEYLTKEVWNV